MNPTICPTCGCSLVRLGISKDQSPTCRHDGEDRSFCCQGCLDLFVSDPQKYLGETSDLIVCPTCLAEKPRDWAVKLRIEQQDVYFCRCPYCPEAFRRDPGYYAQRLAGAIPSAGVLDHEGCCVRPA